MAKIRAAEVVINVTTNAKGASQDMKRLETSTLSLGKVLGTLGLAAVAKKSAELGRSFINAASDAEETRNKFNVVFRDISDAAERSARNLTDNFGLSSRAAQGLLADTGDLLTGFGFTQEEALKLSDQVNTLAVDLASFTNFSGGAEGASAALTKALLGERESIKSLGIAITEADINRLAENKGIVGELTRQQKAALTLELAISQSANAIGDFERSQDSFANQSRIAESAIDDLKVVLGEGLLPIATRAIGIVTDVAKGFSNMSPEARNAALAVGAIVTVGAPAVIAINNIKNAVVALNTTALFGPAGVIVGLTAVVAGLAAIASTARSKQLDNVTKEFGSVSEQLQSTGLNARQAAREIEAVRDALFQGSLSTWTDVAEQVDSIARNSELTRAQVIETALASEDLTDEYKQQFLELQAQEQLRADIANMNAEDALGLEEYLALMKDVTAEQEKQAGLSQGQQDFVATRDKLISDLAKIDERYKVFGDTVDVTAEKAAAYQGAIESLIEQGYKAERDNIQTLIRNYGFLQTQYEEQVAAKEEVTTATEDLIEVDKSLADVEARNAEKRQEFYVSQLEDINQAIFAISKQKEAFIEAGIDEVAAEKWKQEQIAALRQDEFEAEQKRQQQIKDTALSSLSSILQMATTYYEGRSKAAEDASEEEKKRARRSFQIAKAFQVAQALASTYTAAVNTYANTVLYLGPVGAGIAAGVATAFGLARAADIASQQPSFALGTPAEGFTVPEGFQGDNFPIFAQSGETVDITPADNAANGGGGVIRVNLGLMLRDREIGRALFDLSKDGVLLTASQSVVRTA